jgi:hypothetical protein
VIAAAIQVQPLNLCGCNKPVTELRRDQVVSGRHFRLAEWLCAAIYSNSTEKDVAVDGRPPGSA